MYVDLDWVGELHKSGHVVAIGQLSPATVRLLDREVRAGRAYKARGYWPGFSWGYSHLKTWWFSKLGTIA